MANPSSNSPSKDQPPRPSTNPTVQIPDPAPLSLFLPQQQQQYQSPKPTSSSSPSSAIFRGSSGVPTPTTGRCPSSSSSSPSSGVSGRRLQSYRGIRSRSGKWVSEIREPRKTTRIWLGTYPTPEMAATAYDVAAIALKGPGTDLNFPDRVHSYPEAASTSPSHIRAAAAAAAASRLPKHDSGSSKDSKEEQRKPQNDDQGTTTATSSTCMESSCPGQQGEEFIDEEELLNFPNLMVDMAGGMLVSPPTWINSPPSDDSPDNSDVESLWTYT